MASWDETALKCPLIAFCCECMSWLVSYLILGSAMSTRSDNLSRSKVLSWLYSQVIFAWGSDCCMMVSVRLRMSRYSHASELWPIFMTMSWFVRVGKDFSLSCSCLIISEASPLIVIIEQLSVLSNILSKSFCEICVRWFSNVLCFSMRCLRILSFPFFHMAFYCFAMWCIRVNVLAWE